MSWQELLTREMDTAYKAARNLMDLVDEDSLGWKPGEGNNWMTMGQLLKHVSDSCGSGFAGFVTGDWGLPAGMDAGKARPEDMLPPAEKMESVSSVVEAKRLLAEDRSLAMDMLERCSEADLHEKPAPAPWDPRPMILGHRLLQCIKHLESHKFQLFFYLKFQGKPVNTGTLWGM